MVGHFHDLCASDALFVILYTVQSVNYVWQPGGQILESMANDDESQRNVLVFV